MMEIKFNIESLVEKFLAESKFNVGEKETTKLQMVNFGTDYVRLFAKWLNRQIIDIKNYND